MSITHLLAGLATTLALALPDASWAQKKYDPGASDTEIKIGQTMPYSGPASAYGTLGKAEAAFFQKINDEGGINGRKIVFISVDDSYSPAKAVEMTRRLVEQDQVLLMFGSLGTATNSAVHAYLNAVAHLAPGAGAEKAAQLRMQVAAALRGLVLEAAERRELALGTQHTLHRRRADGADQFVFQVGIAGIEAVVLDALARGHAGTLEAAPHVAQLGDVAEPGQPHAQALRTERLHEAQQIGGAADGDDDDAFGLQVAAAAAGEGFEGGLVAPAFDEDGGAGVGGDHKTLGVVGRYRRARAWWASRRCRRFHVRIMPS